MSAVSRRHRLLIAGLFVVSLVLWQVQAAKGDSPENANHLRKIEPSLLKQLMDHPDEPRRFIVQMREVSELPAAETLAQLGRLDRRRSVVGTLRAAAERSQSAVARFLLSEQAIGNVTQLRRFWIFNGLSVTARPSTAFALASRDDVRALLLDREYRLSPPRGEGIRAGSAYTGTVEWNIQKVQADRVWDSLKLDGAGVLVGSMDTGVDWKHPALQSSYRGNAGKGILDHRSSWYCATDEGYAEPADVYGHGTHTMGTILGRTTDHAIGVAPGARWISAKIFKDDGTSLSSWIHAGFQWMLDPGDTGDPNQVPDAVNNSWGSTFGDDITFQADVQAWRAAGIVPVFAAGNDGPFEYTVNAPGSFPESIAVGATDRDDQPASFSSRGPTVWNEVKPEVVAPGYGVFSSLPGDRYGAYNGTSMATPHVTGLVALLLQANPTLSVNRIEELLTSSAVRLGAFSPNNDYGWGRIDAYGAAAALNRAGSLQGVVRSSVDGRPIRGARVTATGLLPEEASGYAVTDPTGTYHIPLAAWAYDVRVSAFGYYPGTANAVPVSLGAPTAQNFTLSMQPSGTIHGFVTAFGSGAPLTATITLSGTGLSTVSSPTTGEYRFEAPPGNYTLDVRRAGYRVKRATDVTVNVDQTVETDFSLSAAPTIVLVDSGVWYNLSQAAYFRQALDALDYVYDVRPIRFPYGSERDVPTAAELKRYDIVIWSSPHDSPGYVSAWDSLRQFLDGGGKLLLTGQNIGYWDGASGQFVSPEYRSHVHARYVRDDAGSLLLYGLTGELLDGLTLDLNGPDSADNQESPDSVRSGDEAAGIPVLGYDGSADAGALETAACSPFRLLYLSFGFEGVSGGSVRRDLMQRALDWFEAPQAPTGVRLTPLHQASIAPPGGVLTYSVQLHNTGGSGEADTYSLTLGPHLWPTTVSSDSVRVAPCGVATVTLRVDIPADAGRMVVDSLTVTARSILSATIEAGAVISTQTAAPILLVDHDRWYDQEAAYRSALDESGLPYDYWNVGWTVSPGLGSPTVDRLKMYPLIVWFTGYDWSIAVSAIEEQRLAKALDSGSRLLLSSQDYLYARRLDDFGRNYLGIGGFTSDITTTEAAGYPGDPIGNLLGPYGLAFPFPDRSDQLEPAADGNSTFLGSADRPIAIRHSAPSYRSTFFAFPIEAIRPDGRAEVLRQAVGWLSWLGRSTLEASADQALPGDTLAYTVTLRNDGPETVTGLVTDSLPIELEPLAGSIFPPEANWDPATRQLTWSGSIAPGADREVGVQVGVDPGVTGPAVITHRAEIAYLEHGIHFQRAAALQVGAPDLSTSSLAVNSPVAQPGDVLTYTISLANRGLGLAASAVLTSPIPEGTRYLSNSLRLDGAGFAVEIPDGIRWDGPIGPGDVATVTYQVQIDTGQYGAQIAGFAWLDDGFSPPRRLRAWTEIGWITYYFPLLWRNEVP